MPAIPIITAVTSIAGGVAQNNQANAAAKTQQNAIKSQTQLEQERLKMEQDKYRNQLLSGNQFWNELNSQQPRGYNEYVSQAQNEYTPLYDEEMTNTLKTVNNNSMARGFFGQAPGAKLAMDAASKVAAAKAGAVGARANQMYADDQNRNLALKQLGLNAFGTYGNMNVPTAPVTPAAPALAPKKKSNGLLNILAPGASKLFGW
jgi:hypothetical protein